MVLPKDVEAIRKACAESILEQEANLRDQLYRRFLRYAKRLRKTNPELATKIERNIDKLVEWYVVNKRELTMEDFSRIIEGIHTR